MTVGSVTVGSRPTATVDREGVDKLLSELDIEIGEGALVTTTSSAQ